MTKNALDLSPRYHYAKFRRRLSSRKKILLAVDLARNIVSYLQPPVLATYEGVFDDMTLHAEQNCPATRCGAAVARNRMRTVLRNLMKSYSSAQPQNLAIANIVFEACSGTGRNGVPGVIYETRKYLKDSTPEMKTLMNSVIQHHVGPDHGIAALLRDPDHYALAVLVHISREAMAAARLIDAGDATKIPDLADELAACNQKELADHFRTPGLAHPKGCYALDAILGVR